MITKLGIPILHLFSKNIQNISGTMKLTLFRKYPLHSTSHPKNLIFNFYFSTDSGKDNPFRPDGDLSREADEIVQMIKGGRPITLTPTPELPEDKIDGENSEDEVPFSGGGSPVMTELPITPTQVDVLENSKPGANGNAPMTETPESVEVQRGIVVPPSDASQVEHVVIKKKSKCKCCEIM